jgi:hypothetical protein
MASICIDMMRGKSALYRAALRETIYETLRNVVGVAAEDRHEMITEYEHNDLNIVANLIGGTPSSDAILVQLTFNEGCTLGKNRSFMTRSFRCCSKEWGCALRMLPSCLTSGRVTAPSAMSVRIRRRQAAMRPTPPHLTPHNRCCGRAARRPVSAPDSRRPAGALFEYRRTRSARMLCGPGED